MTVREILKMGDARLLRVAQPVTAFGTPELHALLKDMDDTMQAANGAGLAAPQHHQRQKGCEPQARHHWQRPQLRLLQLHRCAQQHPHTRCT